MNCPTCGHENREGVRFCPECGRSAGGREDWPALLEALERGDRRALLRITRLITGYLARFGAFEFRDSWEDICQNVLIALIRSQRRGTLRDPRAFVSYTGTITRNELADWLRKYRRPGAASSLGDLEAELKKGDGPPKPPRGADPDLRIDLARALDQLDEKQRQVLVEVYIEGATYEQAAKSLGMPLGSLKRRLTQGLRELRERMGIHS